MSCPFKQYSGIFGAPKTGVHRFRFLDTSVFDYLITIALAVIFTKVTKVPLVISTILMFVLGIIIHMLFGVNTNAVKYLRLSC